MFNRGSKHSSVGGGDYWDRPTGASQAVGDRCSTGLLAVAGDSLHALFGICFRSRLHQLCGACWLRFGMTNSGRSTPATFVDRGQTWPLLPHLAFRTSIFARNFALSPSCPIRWAMCSISAVIADSLSITGHRRNQYSRSKNCSKHVQDLLGREYPHRS